MPIGDLNREADVPVGSNVYRLPTTGSPVPNDTPIWVDDEQGYVPNSILNDVSIAGYGGIVQNVPQGIGDLGVIPQTVPFNTISVATPRGIVQDFPQNAIAFGVTGVWRLNIIIALAFTGANFGRQVELEVFNVDESTIIGTQTYFAGRNQDGMNIGFSTLVDFPVGLVGDLMTVRLDSTDSFLTVVVLDAVFDTNLVSEAASLF